MKCYIPTALRERESNNVLARPVNQLLRRLRQKASPKLAWATQKDCLKIKSLQVGSRDLESQLRV